MRGRCGLAELRSQNLQRRCANRSAQTRGEAPSPSVASLPRPLPAQREEVNPDRPHKQNRSRGALMRPSFVHDDHAKIDSLPAIKEGSGAPKGACHPCPRKKRGCALLPKRRARLSALTLAALATGYYPDGSAPEPGFPKTDFASVLPAWPFCLRLSTHRAEPGLFAGRPVPQSRPGAECISSARGHRPLLRPSKVPSRKAPSLSRIDVSNIIGDVLSSTRLYIEDYDFSLVSRARGQ